MATELYKRYFMFSNEHMEIKKKIAKELGKSIKLGTVIVNGVPKQYTAIILDRSKYRYTDAKLVTQGDIRLIKYTSEEES